MAKASSSQSFFTMVVLLAALIVTTTLIFQQTQLNSKARTPRATTFTYELSEGFNSIASPLVTTMTMQDVCDELSLSELIRWDNYHEVSGPRTYDCDDALISQTEANVAITPDTPLIFNLSAATNWTITGTPARPNYNVSDPSFYIFGYSVKRDLYANSICNMLKSPTLKVKEVYLIDNLSWDTTHDCDNPSENNFPLENGIGYGIWVADSEDKVSPRNKPNFSF